MPSGLLNIHYRTQASKVPEKKVSSDQEVVGSVLQPFPFSSEKKIGKKTPKAEKEWKSVKNENNDFLSLSFSLSLLLALASSLSLTHSLTHSLALSLFLSYLRKNTSAHETKPF